MSMKYVAAFALASLTKPNPTTEDVEAICKAVGVDVDKDTLAFVIESIAGRDVNTLINEGASKLAATSVAAAPAGGAAPAAAAPAGGAAPAGKKAEAAPAEEEGDDDMGFGLFD